VILTPHLTSENITPKRGVTPVADCSHQLTVWSSHHISNSVQLPYTHIPPTSLLRTLSLQCLCYVLYLLTVLMLNFIASACASAGGSKVYPHECASPMIECAFPMIECASPMIECASGHILLCEHTTLICTNWPLHNLIPLQVLYRSIHICSLNLVVTYNSVTTSSHAAHYFLMSQLPKLYN